MKDEQVPQPITAGVTVTTKLGVNGSGWVPKVLQAMEEPKPAEKPQPVEQLSDKNDNLFLVQTKKTLFTNFIEQVKKGAEVIPRVQEILAVCEWQEGVFAQFTAEVAGIRSDDLTEALQRENDYYASVLPVMPRLDKQFSATASAFTASSAIFTLDYISRIEQFGTPAVSLIAKEHAGGYFQLQERQGRPQTVREMISLLLNIGTLDRFDKASQAHDAAKVGMLSPTAAAMEMRLFLEGVKGDLFEFARRKVKEDMNWEIMAERLAINGPGSSEEEELLQLVKVYPDLFNRLSQIGKERDKHASPDIAGLWAQVLDWTYSVLQLIRVPGKMPR
jgi:hypothetical protein